MATGPEVFKNSMMEKDLGLKRERLNGSTNCKEPKKSRNMWNVEHVKDFKPFQQVSLHLAPYFGKYTRYTRES